MQHYHAVGGAIQIFSVIIMRDQCENLIARWRQTPLRFMMLLQLVVFLQITFTLHVIFKCKNWLLPCCVLITFCARQHICYSAYNAIACPSIRPSHGWICQKRLKLGSCNFHHQVPHDSSFLTVNFTPKFQGEHRERGRQLRSSKFSRNFALVHIFGRQPRLNRWR